MSAISALLFDKDGTILDFYKTWIPINREMAHEAAGGDPVLAAELLRAGGHDPDTDAIAAGAVLSAAGVEGIAACFARVLGERTPPNLLDIVKRNFRDGGARHALPIAGALDEIQRMRARGYRLGVATNDTIEGLYASLGRYSDLSKVFDFLVGCDSGHGAKPEPGMGLAFAATMGLDPSSCAIIGDAVHDLEMGRRAGFGLRIGVLTGPAARKDLEAHADLIIDSILDLAKILPRA